MKLFENESVTLGILDGATELPDDTDDVLDALNREAENAVGAQGGQLAEDIEKLNAYYRGDPYGNEVVGQSRFVTREVYETVESIMPYLVKIFFSSDKAVVFDPEDEDDISAAGQETEYVNWVFYQSNPGFKVGYSWIKDGLMNRIGYVGISRESPQSTTERYENLDQEMLASTLADIEKDDSAMTVTVEMVTENEFSVAVSKAIGVEKTVVFNIPPEEISISDGDVDIKTARYVRRKAQRTLSEIRAMGLEVDDDVEDHDDDLNTIKHDRHKDISYSFGDNEGEGASRKVWLSEEYLRIDRNGDGIAELWQFIRVGDEILLEQEVATVHIYAWSPVIMPHRHVGSTPIDPIMDIQLLKSKITRNILDNQQRINRGRFSVVESATNMDDLLSNGDAVRVEFQDAVKSLDTPQLDRSGFELLNYADALAERRSGVSERGQGLDPKMFNSNTAAATAELVMSSAEQKLELIARIFAEDGLKALMLGIHDMGMSHERPEMKIRNNNGEFVTVAPSEWRNRFNMRVTVGIGNGSKDQQMAQMNMIGQDMRSIIEGGGLGRIVTEENIYRFALEKTRISGRQDGALFFTNPKDAEPPGPSIQERLLEIQSDIEKRKAAVEERKIEIEEEELLLDVAKHELEKIKHDDENEFRLAELELEAKQDRPVSV